MNSFVAWEITTAPGHTHPGTVHKVILLFVHPAEMIRNHLYIIIGDVQQAALYLAPADCSVGLCDTGLSQLRQRTNALGS